MEPRKEAFETTRMSLGEHLIELRKRLFRGVLAVLVAFMVGWGFYGPISAVLLEPLYKVTNQINADQVKIYEQKLLAHPELPRTEYFRSENPQDRRLWAEFTIETRPVARGLGDGFVFTMKVALAFALAVGGPILLYQLWQFIAAGLYPKERRMIMSYFPFSVLLFVGGVVFGARLLLPFCMQLIIKAFPPEKLGAQFGLLEYWDFYATMSLALGGIFQLPIVMYALVHVDLVQRSSFAKYRGHFALFAFVFGGVITPPDPWSQFAAALPMVALYELGLLATVTMARRHAREKKRRDEVSAP
jgi:sec-independent protein translocase protein TatC